MRVVFAALVSCALLSTSAFGDDARSAVKEFGLVGAWSSDCSKKLSRITFAAPPDGGPTAIAEDDQGAVVVTTAYEIKEAAIFAGDRIGVAFHPVAITRSDGATAPQSGYSNLHLVFQKVDERIEVIRIQFEGLPEIERAIFFQRCPA